MTAFQLGRGFVLDRSPETAVGALLDDDGFPAEDRACLAELARTTDPELLAELLLDLIQLPYDAAAKAGRDLALRLGHVRLGRCVDTLVRGLSRYGLTLDRRRIRALSDDARYCA